MTFQRPDLLVLAPLVVLLFLLALGMHWRRLRRLERGYDLAAVRRLFPVRLDRFPTLRLLLLVAAGAAIGLAAAGPIWIAPEPVDPPPPLDVAVVVDLSLSMNAEDVAPSRIARAREAIAVLTEELPSVRYSMVVFAGWPYTLLPPTDDPAVARYFAESLRVEIVGEDDRGSALSGSLALARRALEARPTRGARQAMLVLTDGETYEDERTVLDAASAVASDGPEIWVGGLGTSAGEPLSVDGDPVRDASGSAVVTRQNADLLRALADAGGGRYEDVSERAGLESLVAELRELSGQDLEDGPEPVDPTFLLTLLAIPLLLWEGAVDVGRGVRAAGRGEEARS